MGDNSIEVPPFFICPISLEIMKDPVILSTGITYDRESIEKWVFTDKNDTCPVTKQALTEVELTPNTTLRRLIQAWCTLNASFGIERFPTPKPQIGKTQIQKLLKDSKSPQLQMKCLKKLKSIAMENATNYKRIIESAGAVDFLASILNNNSNINNNVSSTQEVSEDGFELTTASDEALSIIYHLQLSQTSLKTLFGKNGEFVESLIHVMQRANYEARTYAVLLLKSMFQVAEPIQVTSIPSSLFIELVQILKDQISEKVQKATIKLLANVCPWGRNRIKAVEAGAVSVLINILLETTEKRANEMVLIMLDQLCQCAEGRADLLKHGAGLAIVSKKILRVSQVGSERGVRILHSVSKCGNGVIHEMLQLGVVAKLCLVLQVDCGSKTKERAREILKLHSRVWKNSPCIPSNLVSAYPA